MGAGAATGADMGAWSRWLASPRRSGTSRIWKANVETRFSLDSLMGWVTRRLSSYGSTGFSLYRGPAAEVIEQRLLRHAAIQSAADAHPAGPQPHHSVAVQVECDASKTLKPVTHLLDRFNG
jgi:hypothetical protein